MGDTDADGDTLTVSAISGGSVGSAVTGTYGTLTIQSNGSYEYVADQSAADTLDAGDTATDVFTYTVSDAAGNKAETKRTVVVKAVKLTLANIQAQDITQTSVNIHWELNKKATGQVEYGETSSYGSLTNKENSFNYQAHTQHIKGLKAETTYHYRVISKDKDGYEVISEDQTFKTLKEDKEMQGLGMIKRVNHQGKEDYICHVCLAGY